MSYDIKPTKIDIPQSEIDHYKEILQLTRLPDEPIISGAEAPGSNYGTRLSDLKSAREQLLNYDWRKMEAELNRFDHYTVEIENTQIHLIHQKSSRSDAIPLLVLHGWPFSILEYRHVIEPLVNPPQGQQAFHVICPSLPGIFMSSIVPDSNHSTPDVARIFNTLMVDVLGYKVYAAHGGDFGGINLRQIQLNHSDTCKLVHFTIFIAPKPASFTDEDFANLPDYDRRTIEARMRFQGSGSGYLAMQTTEVATIGYAVYDGIGMASWMVGKYVTAMKSAKVPDERKAEIFHELLANILALQYTHSNHTSMLMYRQSGLKYIMEAWGKQEKRGAPIGVSLFDGEMV
ncbi:hypothetical protein HGRIS_002404 [Hohenbuehelia grisea]|uniref:Epoxide hydrolase N-terminal domain-containing protein n=1 Tax=Hohenbuehelia grisea TaxID=104357 RepID=A0ABR3JLB1_9AGAR